VRGKMHRTDGRRSRGHGRGERCQETR
jgi:hypothetical protein